MCASTLLNYFIIHILNVETSCEFEKQPGKQRERKSNKMSFREEKQKKRKDRMKERQTEQNRKGEWETIKRFVTCAVHMLLVALSLLMCCSRVCSANR